MVSYRRLAMRVLGHVPVPFRKKKAAPPPRVAAQRIAALALACAMMTGMALPAFADTYNIVYGSIEIHAKEGGNFITQWSDENRTEYYSDSRGCFDGTYKDPDNNVTITGTSTENTVTIEADKGTTANVTLENVNINVDEGYEHGYDPDQYKTAVEVTGSGNANIELNGDNKLTSGYGHAGLEHNKTDDSGTLTIQDKKNDDGSAKGSASDTTGSLTATGGYHSAGIGGSDKQGGQVTITGGEIIANGGSGGAGIGGGSGNKQAVGGDGDVTISGGTITATGGSLGAGIGGGAYGNGTVTVTDGDITAKATGMYGAGIGGGFGAIPKDTLIGGNGTVTISGGTITEASGGYMAAGIGSGYQGLGTVTIEGDAVIKNAQGGEAGAGIGSGTYGDSEIIIKGDAVIENAESSVNGAGIGSGQGDLYPDGDGMVIVPTVGNVTIEGNAKIENAKSGDGGSGIGGGLIGIGNVIIRGNVTIENAQGGMGAAGIGGGALSEPDDDGTGNETGNEISIQGTEAGSPNITAKGGTAGTVLNLNGEEEAISGGAAIGSGSVISGQEKAPAAITIDGKVTIDATAGGSIAKGDAIAIGDALTGERKFDGLPVGAVITRKDSDGKDLTQEGDKPTKPEKPDPEKPDPEKPDPEKPDPEKPDPEKPDPEKPDPEKPNPNPENPDPEKPNPNPENPDPEKPNPNPENPDPEKPNPNPENPDPEKPNPNPENPDPEKPNPNPENPDPEKPNPENPNPENPNPENPNPEQPSNPDQPSEPSGAVSTSAPAEELTASDAEYLVTVEGLSVTNALGKQITHSCTLNAQGKVLTIRVNSIVATAHLTMEMLRTLKAQGVETIRFNTLLYRPTSVSIDALLDLGIDEADILWTHNGIQARLTVGGTDVSSLLQ